MGAEIIDQPPLVAVIGFAETLDPADGFATISGLPVLDRFFLGVDGAAGANKDQKAHGQRYLLHLFSPGNRYPDKRTKDARSAAFGGVNVPLTIPIG